MFVSAAVALPAFAQDEEPAPVTGVAPLIITGTRLEVQDYVSPNPTTSADAQQIERSGETNLGDFLTDYPALVSSVTDQLGAETATPFYVGLNLLDLRNLGTDRTLVLVNGRRHVAGIAGSSAVDVNTIPEDLVERVEIVTGGESAIYGADGVSGVVNFILKDHFDGLSARTQYGWSQDGGGETRFISLIGGRNLRSDEVNVTFAADWYSRADVKFNDRYYTRAGIRKSLFDNPAEATNPVAIPTPTIRPFPTSCRRRTCAISIHRPAGRSTPAIRMARPGSSAMAIPSSTASTSGASSRWAALGPCSTNIMTT